MAKETVKVDNSLEEIKLVSSEEMDKKKDKKKAKNKNNNKESKKSKKQSYFSKVKSEMKLVTWPSKKEIVKYSISSIIMILLFALFFIGITALFDLLYSYVQGWIG